MANEDNSDPLNIVMVRSQESSQKAVKSTAIVKYSAASTPANFARLQCNTDLNSPPSNWLSNSADSYGLQHVLFNPTGFTSFRMAHMFPDCVGEVDVVSDAENIKNLLKLPYSRGPVSMMVHRIENTLLIDEFDIHKYLLRSAETEWAWLKKFFIENIQEAWSEKDLDLYGKSKRRNVLQQKSLMSKFLYHSLVETTKPTNSTKEEDEIPTSLPFSGPALPEPTLEEELPDSTSKHKYNRNVVWTFEDIQMLIGTDMPIFGGSTHPCISLRLRDMNKPISVLTGIDYWLDNLMSNVPEVVMCYHLNGIVQKYEFIKTEDLPHLKDSKFSPKLIRDIAQNILSFLKSNATKAGHTYWLFKGRNDDVVKLYDLTSLCSGVLDEKGQNPFTVPVAMLLYRVARNMKHSSDGSPQSGTIKMLLKNCIELLPKEKYPQIVTSSYYMLSDLYVPADTDPTNPGIESESHGDFEKNEKTEDESCVQSNSTEHIKQLRLNEVFDQDSEGYKYEVPSPITGTIIEKCLIALQYVASGINCLQYFSSEINESKEKAKGKPKKQLESENLNMAKSFEPIPMPYSPINEKNVDSKKKGKKKSKAEKKTKKGAVENAVETPRALLPKPKAEAMPTWQEPDRSDNASWYTHLKTLLYEKCCLVYAILAEQEFLYENYGTSLHYINVLVKCQKILKNLHFSSQHVQESCLLGRAGDCCCMIEKHWNKIDEYRHQYFTNTDAEGKMLEEISKDLPDENEEYENWRDLLPSEIENNEQMLLISCRCYERALSAEPGDEKTNLLRRLGNVQNELGSYYMNQVCVTLNDSSPTNNVETLISKSLYYLETGIRTFESIDDKINLALLHSNMGRLMRLCAHLNSGKVSDKLSEIVGQEKIYYNKALASYQKARQILLNRSTNPEIWDAITWELSTASYNMATLLQDYPTLGSRTTKQLEQEVVELLHKALEFCDMETPSYRQPIYQFRGAKIHHRLASLYHNSFRKMPLNDSRRKSVLILCKLHYERAGSILLLLEDTNEYLNVQLEYLAFYLLLFQNATSLPLKYKHLTAGLNILLSTTPIISMMKDKATSSPEKQENSLEKKREKDFDTNSVEAEEKDMHLLKLIETQLQFVLLNLTKLFAKPTKNITSEHCSTHGACYKQMYGLALRIGSNQSKNKKSYIEDLAKILDQIQTEIAKLEELNL